MPPVELAQPVRILADLAPPPWLPARAARRASARPSWFGGPGGDVPAAALSLSGALFLQLGYPPPGAGPARRLMDLVRMSAGRNMSVSLVTADGAAPLAELAAAGLREAVIDLTAARGRHPSAEDFLGRARDLGLAAGVRWRPARRNIARLPALLAGWARAGCGFVDLPPHPLVYLSPAEAAGCLPGPGDYRRLMASLPSPAGPPAPVPELRIHDVLLWAIIDRASGARRVPGSGFQGCQGAAGLAFIAPDGTVFPCWAVPRPLGRIGDLADAGFWRTPAVSEARKSLEAARPECRVCRAAAVCRGACPGGRLAATGSTTGEDPLCSVFEEIAG